MISHLRTLALVLWTLPGLSAAPQMLPHDVVAATDLVASGVGRCLIVWGAESDQARSCALRIQKCVEGQVGVRLALTRDRDIVPKRLAWPKSEFRDANLILIGNIHTNWAIIPLYANYLAAVDGDYPGGEGYVLRTVVNPYGTGANHIVVGASTAGGQRRATDAFLKRLGSLPSAQASRLPRLLEIVPEGVFADTVRGTRPDRRGGFEIWAFTINAFNYQWTGKSVFAEIALAQLRRSKALDESPPPDWQIGHYGKEAVVRAMIILLKSGLLSDVERMRLENTLLRSLVNEQRSYWIVRGGYWPGTRHQSMGMMGFLTTAHYLLTQAKPNQEARKLLERYVGWGEAFFDQFLHRFRGENADNGSYHSAEAYCRYMMAFGRTEFFDGGMVRLKASAHGDR